MGGALEDFGYSSGMGYTYLSQACFKVLDHLGSVGALACPSFGFYARPQIPLARTRAEGPRVRDLYVGVAPDLCISGHAHMQVEIFFKIRDVEIRNSISKPFQTFSVPTPLPSQVLVQCTNTTFRAGVGTPLLARCTNSVLTLEPPH